MGILEQARRIAEANVDVLVDASPDPLRAVRRLLVEAEQTRRALRRAIAEAHEVVEVLDRRHEQAAAEMRQWIKRSKVAEERGRPDLAGGAAVRYSEAARECDRIKDERDRLTRREQKIAEDLAHVEARIPHLKGRRRQLQNPKDDPSPVGMGEAPPPHPPAAEPALEEPVGSTSSTDDLEESDITSEDPLEATFLRWEAESEAGDGDGDAGKSTGDAGGDA